MKIVIFTILSITMLTACKKNTKQLNNTSNSNSNTNTCIDNPNINFSCLGTPIGKFGECIKDIDGNTYKTVTIGTQTWMAENLKVNKYNDGTAIPNVSDNIQWQKNRTGAWCNYSNSDSLGKVYGKLYNWYAVSTTTNGNKNICPTGWHVPTDLEFTTLTDFLGGENIAGGKMKEVTTKKWNTPNTDATNSSLFTGLPSQFRDLDGTFNSMTQIGAWWSSTESKSDAAWTRYLVNTNGVVYRIIDGDKEAGFSIRCIKD